MIYYLYKSKAAVNKLVENYGGLAVYNRIVIWKPSNVVEACQDNESEGTLHQTAQIDDNKGNYT